LIETWKENFVFVLNWNDLISYLTTNKNMAIRTINSIAYLLLKMIIAIKSTITK
jgi:hypothetical protein